MTAASIRCIRANSPPRCRRRPRSQLPVLLRVNAAGHGMGSSRNERIDEDADILAFLYEQLGVTWRESSAPPPR